MSTLLKWMRGRRVVGLIMSLIVCGFVATTLATPATAAPSVHRGAGKLVGGYDWVGQEVTDGHTGYCIDPPKRLDYGQTWTTISILKAIGTTKSRELEYILYRYGNTKNNDSAAAVRMALNEIVGNNSDVKRWQKALGKTITNRAAGYVKAARLYYGPYKVVVKPTKTVLVGQTGSDSISLTSAAKHGVPGVTLDLSVANATVSKSVRTNSKGAASVSLPRTGTGVVKLTATAVGLAPTTMLLSNAHVGQQRLLSWSPGTTAHGSAAYQKSSSGTVKYSCTTICNGKPPVTYTWCHAANEGTRLYHVLDNGRIVKTIEIKQSSKSSCASATVIIPDTHKASATCSYYNSKTHKWGAAVSCGPTVVVDCPPWPVVDAHLSCNCLVGNLDLTLPKSTLHALAMNYSLDNGKTWTKVVENKGTATCKNSTSAVKNSKLLDTTCVVHLKFDRSKATTDVVFYGSVQRTNGVWNGDPKTAEEVIVRKV